jgi:hypothetical protein
MSLDITILDARGRPSESVAFSPDEHWQIFGQLAPSDFPLLSRLADFYEDAEWLVDELPFLKDELLRLKASLPAEEQHFSLVDAVIALAQSALKMGSSLVAIAD